MTATRIIAIFLVFACACAVVRAETDEGPPDKTPKIFRPSTAAERIAGLSLVGIERLERKDGTPVVRLVMLFEAGQRSLFAEHIPLLLNTGSAQKTPQKIQIEIGMQRKLTPVRFVAVARDGKAEAETWLVQSAEAADEDANAPRTGFVVCPPAAPGAGTGKPETVAPPPPLDRRISLIPGLLAHGQHAVDKNTGAAINVGGHLAPSLGLAAGYLWTKTFESVFEVKTGSYALNPFPNGTLLDTASFYWTFGAGGRLYLSDSKGTWVELVLLYDRRFFIRAAGSGYFAASAFDFPEAEARVGMTLIRPKRWGLFTEIDVHGITGAWTSNLKVQSGYGADIKIQGVLRHPLAQLRFGPAYGYEKVETNLVSLTNQRLRFELALDWEL